MTAIVRALCVDDYPDDAQLRMWAIQDIFGDHCDCRFDWSVPPGLSSGGSMNNVATSAVEVAARLRDDAALTPFDLVVVDILFPPPGAPKAAQVSGAQRDLGMQVIEAARQRSPDTAILAMSSGQGDDVYPDWMGTARLGGATATARRAVLRKDNEEGRRAVDELFWFLAARDVVTPHLGLEASDDDAGALGLLERVGRGRLLALLGDLLGDLIGTVSLSYVAPGASGASVVRVDLGLEGAEPVKSHLLKVSRDVDALERELRNGRDLDAVYDNGLIIFQNVGGGEVANRDGWGAIISPYQENAGTLRNWIVSDEAREAESVYSLLESLFLGRGLSHQYASTAAPGPAAVLESLELTPERQVRAGNAVSNLQELVPDDVLRAGWQADLQRFVRHGALPTTHTEDIAGQPMQWALSHGDLHGDNVLVSRDRRPRAYVVDVSDFRRHAEMVDITRLATDLITRSFDLGAASFSLDRFATWMTVFDAISAGDAVGLPAVTGDDSNLGPLHALGWLLDNRETIHGTVLERPWEWHLTLASQMLRAMSNDRVWPAKRVFALVAASQALDLADETWRRAH